LTPEEEQFSREIIDKMMLHGVNYRAFGFFDAAYAIAVVLMIAMTKQKTGLHDVICNTRAIRGTIG
jgi:hypothetical protein